MYLSLIVAFLLLLGIIIAAIQNTAPLDVQFITWKLQMPLSALIFYTALLGAAVVSVLFLPKLAAKMLGIRKLKKEISQLQKSLFALERKEEKKNAE